MQQQHHFATGSGVGGDHDAFELLTAMAIRNPLPHKKLRSPIGPWPSEDNSRLSSLTYLEKSVRIAQRGPDYKYGEASVPDTLYNSVADFVAGVLSTADPSVTVVIAIPSRTRKDKEVKDQDQRADAALELFARLFTGATGYRALGSYLSETGAVLKDEPIMIESLASNEEIRDKNRLRQLGDFARRLARETDQESVFVAIDNTRHSVGRGR